MPTQPNRKITKTGPRVRFRGSVEAPLERTQSEPRPDAKQPRAEAKRTSKANPNFRSGSVKRTPGPLYIIGLSIMIPDKPS